MELKREEEVEGEEEVGELEERTRAREPRRSRAFGCGARAWPLSSARLACGQARPEQGGAMSRGDDVDRDVDKGTPNTCSLSTCVGRVEEGESEVEDAMEREAMRCVWWARKRKRERWSCSRDGAAPLRALALPPPLDPATRDDARNRQPRGT
jgi:hypothetical protein